MPRPDAGGRPPRHAFVRLATDWPRQLRTPLPESDQARIAAWRAAGRPFVVARAAPGDDGGMLRLGLALPDRTRLGFGVAATAVAAVRPPPPLDDVTAAAPASWRERLQQAAAIACHHRVTVAVYGSLAWQALTGQAYLRPGSDIDLLLDARRWGDLMDITNVLAGFEGAPRLDGEALLPDGAAVAWRELAGAPERLLVKGPAGVDLVRYADVRGRFMARAA